MTGTETKSAYATAIEKRDEARVEIQMEVAAHEMRMKHWQAAEAYNNRIISAAESGAVSAEDAVTAERILVVKWERRRHEGVTRPLTAEVHEAVEDSIEHLRHGGGDLLARAMGVKHFDRWESQRENHAYGYGPRHGYIWFSIGMRVPRLEVSPENALACIRWLRAMVRHPESVLGPVSS